MKQYTISERDWRDIVNLSMQAKKTPDVPLGNGLTLKQVAVKKVMDRWLEIGERMGFDGRDVRPVNPWGRIVKANPVRKGVIIADKLPVM